MFKFQSANRWLVSLCLSIFLLTPAVNAEQVQPQVTELQQLTQQLAKASYKEKSVIVNQISDLQDEGKLRILQALLASDLYYRKSDKLMVIVSSFKEDAGIKDAFTSSLVENIGKRKFKKVGVNNSLRKTLRSAIALVEVSTGDKAQRYSAATDLLKVPATVSIEKLTTLIKAEENVDVSEVLVLTKALKELQSEDQDLRLSAIIAMERSLHSEVRAALSKFVSGFSEEEKTTRSEEFELATKTIASIDQLLEMNSYAENLYFGLSLGAVLLLAAIGLAITFGVMGGYLYYF